MQSLRLAPVFLAALSVPEIALASPDALRQVAGILDYVAADYAGAVGSDGTVVDAAEYEEQLSLLGDARRLVADSAVPADHPVAVGLDELLADVQRRVPPDQVRDASRRVRTGLVEDLGLIVEPAFRPSAERGARLYETQGCGSCHGATGAADTEIARTLDPAPANFQDPSRMGDVSPYRAFHSITHGVPGTAMTAFTHLSESERWDLAFHVTALRHADAGDDGEQALAAAGWPVAPSYTRLSQLTERDLEAELKGLPEGTRPDALAWLRAKAPYEDRRDSATALARERLADGVRAYQAGDPSGATSAFVSAYLDGIEPHEAALAAKDPELVRAIEDEMLAIRTAVAADAPVSEIVERSTRILRLLDRAEEDGLADAAVAGGAFVIALREGFEMVLLVGALLMFVRREKVVRGPLYVHGGWMTAAALGLVTWFAVGRALDGVQREIAEAALALVAVTILVGMTHWTLGQAVAREWVGFLGRKVRASSGARWAAASAFVLSFVAVYREIVEVVLFYRTLLLDAPAGGPAAVAGTAAGIGVLAAGALLARRSAQRLQPGPIMLVTSGLLAVIAVMLVGKAVHALQEAGVAPIHPVALPEIAALGMHGTVETIAAQVALAALLLASAVTPVRKALEARGEPPGQPGATIGG
jgi:high-affinity iron transporter